MKMADLGPFEECFTHVDDATGQQTTWAVDRLYALCAGREDWKFMIPVEAEQAEFLRLVRGVEIHRMRRLLTDEGRQRLVKPLLFVKMAHSGGSHVLLDGTHRYVMLWHLKIPRCIAYIVPFDAAKSCIIEDAPMADPEILMKSRSGL